MAAKAKVNASESSDRPSGIAETIAAVAVVGIGAALIEVELIPGILIGVGAMLLPKLVPGFAAAMRPVVRTAIRGGYSAALKTKEAIAEAREQVEDIVAEARAEREIDAAAAQQSPGNRSITAH